MKCSIWDRASVYWPNTWKKLHALSPHLSPHLCYYCVSIETLLKATGSCVTGCCSALVFAHTARKALILLTCCLAVWSSCLQEWLRMKDVMVLSYLLLPLENHNSSSLVSCGQELSSRVELHSRDDVSCNRTQESLYVYKTYHSFKV